MPPSLTAILDAESVQVHFQPIVSIKKKALLGIEALARARDADGAPVNPVTLFNLAAEQGRLLELDRLCRRKALETYAAAWGGKPDAPLLFMNFESSVLDQGVAGSGAILSAARAAGVHPQDIVIEVNESKVQDLGALRKFVEAHREEGFLIALDDLGAGHSNLARIADLKPHILKLDRSLISDLEGDYFKQETVKSIAGLGRRVGAMILAEGVETKAETEASLDLGAELLQGYYFGRPLPLDLIRPKGLLPIIIETAQSQRRAAAERIQKRRLDSKQNRRLLEEAVQLLGDSELTDFEAGLVRLARSPGVECLYLLDRMGLQVTSTVEATSMPKKRSRLYAPAPKGADHSIKEYFYGLLDAGLERYTTEPYLSLASGNSCRTLSGLMRHKEGGTFVLCLDVRADQERA